MAANVPLSAIRDLIAGFPMVAALWRGEAAGMSSTLAPPTARGEAQDR
jgi:hypothetical protein